MRATVAPGGDAGVGGGDLLAVAAAAVVGGGVGVATREDRAAWGKAAAEVLGEHVHVGEAACREHGQVDVAVEEDSLIGGGVGSHRADGEGNSVSVKMEHSGGEEEASRSEIKRRDLGWGGEEAEEVATGATVRSCGVMR